MRNVGIYYAFWTKEWDVDFLPFVAKVKRLGFDQLEVNGGTLVRMSAQNRGLLRERALREGIDLSYGIGLTPECDVSSLDEEVRRRGVAFMREMIRAVGAMGGGMIGGTVHSYWPAVMPEGLENKQPVWEQSIRSMEELLPLAEKEAVILNVEVINRFEQFLLNTAEEARSYVEQFNHPHLGILLDTFHMNIEEDDFAGAIHTAGKHLKALHLGETNRKPPGLGRIPWTEIKTALDAVAFDGPLVMEPFISPGGTVGRNIGVWRELMKGADPDREAGKACEFVRRTLV